MGENEHWNEPNFTVIFMNGMLREKYVDSTLFVDR